MKKLIVVIALFSFALVSAGCWPLFFIGAGGAGMYAASKDTIQGETDVSYESLWDAAMTVAKVRGTIKKQDFDKGSIEVMEGKATLWITLEKLTAATTRMKVASRKYKMPNLDLAQIVYTKILDQAKTPEPQRGR
jgi:hypothetical protein